MPSERYNTYIKSPLWYSRSASYKALTCGRCSILPILKANVSHHLTYNNLESEKYIRDCIPLSHFVHEFIHKNPIGAFFWKDRLGRRRWMNAVLRLIAIIVTICAQMFKTVAIVFNIVGTIYSPLGHSANFAFGIYARIFSISVPKLKAKPKLKRRKKSHV